MPELNWGDDSADVGLQKKDRLTTEEFKALYMCEWKTDPMMSQCVAFMRYATPAQVRQYKREGLFTEGQIREARRIIAHK